MTELRPVPASHTRAVRLWLLAVAAMIFLTLVVGGATRLTEIRPLDHRVEAGDRRAAAVDRTATGRPSSEDIRRFRNTSELNRGMSLDEFKMIYWWEWTHRLLARSTGAVFLLPFLFFLWRGWIPQRLRARLWTIFGAGALLGAVGWWMVSSGLAGTGRVSVSQYRLAFHLTLACAIYRRRSVDGAADRRRERRRDAPARLRVVALVIAVLVLLQIYLGALVAGLDAGLIYNTWPLIDGAFIPAPARLWFLQAGVAQSVREHADRAIRSPHGGLCDLGRRHAARQRCLAARGARRRGALILAGAGDLQAALGIVTLLHQAPLALALAHQMVAIMVLTVAVVHAERLWHGEGLLAPKPATRERTHDRHTRSTTASRS